MNNRFKCIGLPATDAAWEVLVSLKLTKGYTSENRAAMVAFVRMAYARYGGALDGRLIRSLDFRTFGNIELKIHVEGAEVTYKVPLLSETVFGVSLECSSSSSPTLVVETTKMSVGELQKVLDGLGISDAISIDHFGPSLRTFLVESKFGTLKIDVDG